MNRISTLKEVATAMQVSERWLREFIRRKQIGVLRSGRIVRFDEAALSELEEAMRCRYASPVGKTQARSRLSARSPESAYADALRLTTVGSRKKKQTT
jgi:excisionase family DNA binding protein